MFVFDFDISCKSPRSFSLATLQSEAYSSRLVIAILVVRG
jgi:hypothetical protein